MHTLMKPRRLLNWQEHQSAEAKLKLYKTLSPASIVHFKQSQKSVCFSRFNDTRLCQSDPWLQKC
ncbi:hypothetical protein JG687_00017404 [Phytophthora cactorum]|uniref:Uncharacterized protein n=1 Tax=Phytophthora cactorum TaxID=29920 RepID=A0A8T1TS52_9STRA|nr:hypothetical protein JG687_00017404 [Phytophthora cactorum]